jgi:hypothetical protein
MAQVATPATVTFKRNAKDTQWYSANTADTGDFRLTCQGNIVTYVSSGITTPPGFIVVEYDVEFLYPELEALDAGTQYAPTIITTPGTAGTLKVTGGLFNNSTNGDVYLAKVAASPTNVSGLVTDVMATIGAGTDQFKLTAGDNLWLASWMDSGTLKTFAYKALEDARAGSFNSINIASGLAASVCVLARRIASRKLRGKAA